MIKIKEDELFAEWSQQRNGFVSDGLVNEAVYKASEMKLLFVLKEVNDPDGGDWDLREFVRDGGRPQTWDNVSRWVHGIRNNSHVPSWDFYEEIDKDFRVKILQSICAVNLKKSPGGHTADNGSIWHVIQQDYNYLKKQFNLYNPDLVVCCGTGDMFHWLISEQNEASPWETTSRGIYHFKWGRVPVISFPHPVARVSPNILMYALTDAVQEILNNNNTNSKKDV